MATGSVQKGPIPNPFETINAKGRYAAVFEAKPAVRLNRSFDFTIKTNDDEVRLLARDILGKDSDGVPYPVGIRIEVNLIAENPDDAIMKAGDWASGFVATTSFVTNIGIGEIKEGLACNITEGENLKEFMQFFHDLPVPSSSIRDIDPDPLIALNTKLFDANTKYLDRIARAIAWYVKGLREINSIDKFTAIWFGFETISEPLKEVLAAPDMIRHCSNCGFQEKFPSLTGMRAFLKANHEDGEGLYREANDLRVSIIHSTRRLTEVTPEAGRVAPVLQPLLRKAVIFLLGLEPRPLMDKKPIANVLPIKFALKGRFVDAPKFEQTRFEDDYAHFEVTGTKVGIHVQNDKTLKYDITPNWKLLGVIPPARLEMYGHRMYYEDGVIKDVQASDFRAT